MTLFLQSNTSFLIRDAFRTKNTMLRSGCPTYVTTRSRGWGTWLVSFWFGWNWVIPTKLSSQPVSFEFPVSKPSNQEKQSLWLLDTNSQKLITRNKLELRVFYFWKMGLELGQAIGSSGSCGYCRIVVKMFCRSKIPNSHAGVQNLKMWVGLELKCFIV